jgi:hypothetical protein
MSSQLSNREARFICPSRYDRPFLSMEIAERIHFYCNFMFIVVVVLVVPFRDFWFGMVFENLVCDGDCFEIGKRVEPADQDLADTHVGKKIGVTVRFTALFIIVHHIRQRMKTPWCQYIDSDMLDLLQNKVLVAWHSYQLLETV